MVNYFHSIEIHPKANNVVKIVKLALIMGVQFCISKIPENCSILIYKYNYFRVTLAAHILVMENRKQFPYIIKPKTYRKT